MNPFRFSYALLLQSRAFVCWLAHRSTDGASRRITDGASRRRTDGASRRSTVGASRRIPTAPQHDYGLGCRDTHCCGIVRENRSSLTCFASLVMYALCCSVLVYSCSRKNREGSKGGRMQSRFAPQDLHEYRHIPAVGFGQDAAISTTCTGGN